MSSKVVLQLGAGPLMIHSIRLIRELGHQVYAADRNPNAPAFALADGSQQLDICDADGVTDYARRIRADVILAVNEAGVLPAAEASARLRLPNVSPAVAMRCLDKGMMRDAWQAAGLPQPDYRIAHDPEEIAATANQIGYPIVLKPALNWGSRGVSFVDKDSELPWAVDFAQINCRNGRYLVEKAITGTEMTIEGLVQGGRPQVLAKSDKEPQQHPKFRVAMALNYPARFDPWQLELANDVVAKAAMALGIENGAFHCECMINAHGVYLIEMAARGGGGHIFGQIVQAVSGVCMPQALVRILLGEDVDVRPRCQLGACYKFFAPPKGIFQAASGVEEAKRMPGILDFGFTMEPGTRVDDISGDADRPGFVVATGADRDEAIANANRAIGTVRYVMQRIEQPA
ncbi:MAG: ATP-grasp domain-containing protein [Pirellulales bacterium]